MADEQTIENQEVNYLEMSDEDVLKAPIPDFAAMAANSEKKNEKEDGEEAADTTKNNEGGGKEDGEDDNKTGEAGQEEEDGKAPAAEGKPSADADKNKLPEGEDKNKPAAEKEKPAKEENSKEAEKQPAEEIDYAAAGKELLAPFKANGREVQVKSVEDARALMQMGANYNKKMSVLKPHLKVVKLLENHGLLDEAKLSFLIDLDRKDPAAINKLVKDAGLNPMDLDGEKAGDYKPTNRSVDDREVNLDSVLDDLKGSSSYTRVITVVSKEWDEASKRVVYDHPEILRAIHEHMERGMYDKIVSEVENERTFGRLQGLSDIEAYRQVGDRMFAPQGNNSSGRSQGTAKPGDVVQPKPKKEEDAQREEKRKAASGNRAPASNTASKTPVDFNPLALDDKEFEKQSKNFFR